jgi:hypothetical protein
MPIRVNLLAEAKNAEEMRRRDPVKLAIYIGVLLVVISLVISSSLQLEAFIAKSDLAKVQSAITSHTNEYQQVLNNQNKIAEARKKLDALQKLTDTRFLQGNLLNALQQTTTPGVQLTRIRLDQSYFSVPGTASVTNDDRVIPGRPTMTTEKIMMSLDARDSSANPGDQVNKFKDIIANQSYFKSFLNKTNGIQLVSLSPPQNGSDGRPYVLFSLECAFPELTR